MSLSTTSATTDTNSESDFTDDTNSYCTNVDMTDSFISNSDSLTIQRSNSKSSWCKEWQEDTASINNRSKSTLDISILSPQKSSTLQRKYITNSTEDCNFKVANSLWLENSTSESLCTAQTQESQYSKDSSFLVSKQSSGKSTTSDERTYLCGFSKFNTISPSPKKDSISHFEMSYQNQTGTKTSVQQRSSLAKHYFYMLENGDYIIPQATLTQMRNLLEDKNCTHTFTSVDLLATNPEATSL